MMTNDITLASYETGWRRYIQMIGILPPDWHDWLAAIARRRPPGSKVLEIGSGNGRHAQCLIAQGVAVECSDAAHSFVRYLQDQQLDARQLNILTTVPPQQYGLIFAMSVFHHFDTDEFTRAVWNAQGGLITGGLLAIVVRRGQGTQWEHHKVGAPRYFRYREPGQLWDAIEECGLTVINMQFENSGSPGPGYTQSHGYLLAAAVKSLCDYKDLLRGACLATGIVMHCDSERVLGCIVSAVHILVWIGNTGHRIHGTVVCFIN